jgi:hypothetical protein
MSGAQGPIRGAGPGAVAADYARHAARLLIRLAEPGFHAERREDRVVLVRGPGAVATATGIPAGALADLLHCGAVRCETRQGRARFLITEAGRARLRRAAAEDDGFGAQHRRIETRVIAEDGARETVRINVREDALSLIRHGRLATRFLGTAEIEAGERLRRDLAAAQMMPRVTSDWSRLVVDGVAPGQGLSLSEAAMSARQRVSAAMAAVDADLRGILIDVCGFAKGIETLEREHDVPARSGKVVLAFALRQLARHYGLGNAAQGPERAPICAWGTPDSRPRLRAG